MEATKSQCGGQNAQADIFCFTLQAVKDSQIPMLQSCVFAEYSAVEYNKAAIQWAEQHVLTGVDIFRSFENLKPKTASRNNIGVEHIPPQKMQKNEE